MNTDIKKEEIVMRDSPDAATYRENICGWVSRDGQYFGNKPDAERLARWQGCTHVHCEECGEAVSKRWTHCESCREDNRHERWLKRPAKEWDGKTMLYSETLDKYYNYEDETDEDREEFGGLDLVICEPVRLHHIDEEHWEDELRLEDGYAELPQAVLDAVERLNAEIDKMEPVTWEPGRYRVE